MSRSITSQLFYAIMHRPWLRIVTLGVIYSAVILLCFAFAYELRFDFDVPDRFEPQLFQIALIVWWKMKPLPDGVPTPTTDGAASDRA